MATNWMGGTDFMRLAIEAWRDAAHRVIDAQAAALLAALGGSAGTGGQSPLEQWTDAQRELWRGLLAVTGEDGPRGAGPIGPEAAGDTIDALRRAAEHLVQSQADWAKAWTEADRRDGA